MTHKTYKITAIILLIYTIIGGFLMPVPRLIVLNETIRSLYFHVPMWFGMILLLTASCAYSIMHLSRTPATSVKLRKRLSIFNITMLSMAVVMIFLKIKGFQAPLTIGLITLFFSFTLIVFKHFDNDIIAEATAKIGLVLGILGIITGMLWAKYTWGEYWSGDAKQNSAAISLLIYAAYIILRGSINEAQQRAQISAIYNIFAYAALIPLLFILPRLTDSLHPGNGGNPAFGNYDLNNTMRTVFYPAIIAWTLIATWIAELIIRIKNLENKNLESK